MARKPSNEKRGRHSTDEHARKFVFTYFGFSSDSHSILRCMTRHATIRNRRVEALLAMAGLGHWRGLVLAICEQYAGLEDVTVGVDEGARAEIVGLLRQRLRVGKFGNDGDVAEALSGLGFLDYRVHRVENGQLGALWLPNACTLADFRRGWAITAYPDARDPLPTRLTARLLLRCLPPRGAP